MKFNNRQIQEFLEILNKEEAIPYSFFIKEFGISERTLRNDLNSIDTWLMNKKMPILLRNKYEGICLQLTGLIKEEMSQEIRGYSLSFSAKNDRERRTRILLFFFKQQEATLMEISKILNISRNTILKDLELLEEYIKSFGCELKKIQRKGIVLEGNEYNLRNLYIDCLIKECGLKAWDISRQEVINRKNEFFQEKIMEDLFENLPLDEIIKKVSKLQQRLNLRYTDESKNIILAVIAISMQRAKRRYNIDIKAHMYEAIIHSKEYRESFEIFEDLFLKENYSKELSYISIYLATKKVLDGEINIIEDSEIRDLRIFIEKMIEIMEDYSKIKVNEKEKLTKGLLLHLEPAIYRMKYNVMIENPMVEEIKNKYPIAYNSAKLACNYLSQMLSIKVVDEEIAYVAVHFGSFIYSQEKSSKTKVVLVCGEGLSTVRLLEKALKETFEGFEIIEIMGYSEYKDKSDEIVGLVISTIDLSGKNIVKVNPFLSKEDIENLEVYLKKRKNISIEGVSLEKVLEIVEKYAQIYDKAGLIEELKLEIEGIKKPSIVELLTKDKIIFRKKVKSWEEAVEIAAQPLIKDKSIEYSYVEKMKENIKNLKAYVVIKKGVAIPHARPEDGVNKLGFSILILEEGINFNHPKNDPVHIVLCTAYEDRITHTKAFYSFMDFIGKDNNIKKLRESQTHKEVEKLLAKKQKDGE